MKINFKKNSQICMVFDRIQPEYVVIVCLSTLSDLNCYYFLILSLQCYFFCCLIIMIFSLQKCWWILIPHKPPGVIALCLEVSVQETIFTWCTSFISPYHSSGDIELCSLDIFFLLFASRACVSV